VAGAVGKAGWKTAGQNGENMDLWKRLAESGWHRTGRVAWVPGKPAVEGNERDDALAQRGIDEVMNGAGR